MDGGRDRKVGRSDGGVGLNSILIVVEGRDNGSLCLFDGIPCARISLYRF
jgi:hypothetical protein